MSVAVLSLGDRNWGRFAWPPWMRENGRAAVRYADLPVMLVRSCDRMASGIADRNCRLSP